MPTEKICADLKGSDRSRLLNAIEKVRLQKQRPSVERIHKVLRQSDPDVSMADVGLELEKAARDGVILKVVTNNLCSYKLQPSSGGGGGSKSRRNSLPVLKVLPNPEFLDSVVSLVSSLDSCSVEALESQLRRKYALELTGDLSLRQELHDCCRKLVKLGRLQKDGLFFCLPPPSGTSHDSDSLSESPIWKSPTIRLEDCTSERVRSSESLQTSAPAIERLRDRGKQRGTDDRSANKYGFFSGNKGLVSDSRLSKDETSFNDLYAFSTEHQVLKSTAKPRPQSTKTKARTSPEQDSQPDFSNGGRLEGDVSSEMERCVGSSRNEVLATCDSTTHHAVVQVGDLLESQSLTSWHSRSDRRNVAEKEEVVGKEDEEKPKKRSRGLQLAFLYDSLSKFFTASGEKRSATQRSSWSSPTESAVRSVPQVGSMSLRVAAVPKPTYDDRDQPEVRTRENSSSSSKPCEKSKSSQRRPGVAKEFSPKQGLPLLTKSSGGGGGGSDAFSSPVTEEDSQLFEIAQTIAQERYLVTRRNFLSNVGIRSGRTRVIFGKYEFESTQQTPYLPEYSTLPQIYVCEFCLKCFKTRSMLERHLQKCSVCRPPGEELYRDNSLSLFEVHGSREPVYCRHLLLFARLFLDHPGLYCQVSQTIYYVTTISDRSGCHLVGFHSKEKFGEHNLACLLVLPQHRGKGFGHFMVHLSYWLSSTDETPKHPKPPLTETAKWIYHSVWKRAITECIEREDLTEITVRVVSCLTGIREEDVQTMLCELGLMSNDDPRHRVVALTPALREILQIKAEEKTRPIEFNPAAFLDSRLTRKLRGKPRAMKRNISGGQSNPIPVAAKRQQCSENGEAVGSGAQPEATSALGSRWKGMDNSSAVPLPKRKVGWPKGLKRGPRKEKIASDCCESDHGNTLEAIKPTKEAAADVLEAEDGMDFESSLCDGKSGTELEEMNVSTSEGMTRQRESSVSPFERNRRRQDDDEELLSDREGSTISEMPQLDEKEDSSQNSDNDLEFGRSPSPPHLEQEIPSPYFCSDGYMKHGLDMGSKDAESVLSDCLAGRSVAPSPCFSADGRQSKLDKQTTDDESDADPSNDRLTGFGGQSSPLRSATPRSPSDVVESIFAASRASNSVPSIDENSLSSTGFSRSSSVGLRTFVEEKSFPPESPCSLKESPNSNEEKPSSVRSPDSIRGDLSSLSSPGFNRDNSSRVETPISLKEKVSVESPASVKDKSSSLNSPSSFQAKLSSAAVSPESVRDDFEDDKKTEEEEEKCKDVGTQRRIERSSDVENRSENGSIPSDRDDLPYDGSSIVSLPPSGSLPCCSEAEERKNDSGKIVEQVCSMRSVPPESILPPVLPLKQPVQEQFVEEPRMMMTPRPAKEVPGAFCGSFANQSPTSAPITQQGQHSTVGRGPATGLGYPTNGHGAVTSSPLSHSNQMINSALSRYESSEAGRLDISMAQQQQQQQQPHHHHQHHHHPMAKVGSVSENNLESSPAASAARTFSEPIAPQSVLMEAMSPNSFQLQNNLPPRAAKSGNNLANSFSHCNDLSSILTSNSHGNLASRQAMSANAAAAAMAGTRSAAALSPGYMNSMGAQSPMAKGMTNNYGQSKSSAMMANRSNAGRPNSSQQVAAAAAAAAASGPPGGNFGHQQMTKQILSNKYNNKAMTSNVQLQNLSPCGVYGLPKSSPSAGVPQGISNSSPNINYSAVPNLSPGNGDCANASFHSLAGHGRNIVNASPAPGCSGKQYSRSLQHGGNSRGFGGGGGGALSPSPKQSGVSSLYQLPPSQNTAPSPHQIQAPSPYMHGSMQRHVAEQVPPGSESFSRQQGYMFQATYLAKLQQLTNDLGPFQTHYAMALPPNMSPSPIDMTLPSHASPQRNMTPPNLPAQRHGAKQQIHRGSGGAQHKSAPGSSAAASSATAPGFLPDVPGGDMIARYQLLSGYHVQQPMTCPSFIHQGSPSQIPMQVGVMNVGAHAGQPSPNFMPGVQGQPNSAVYAAYGYINGGLAPQSFNMHLNDLMRR